MVWCALLAAAIVQYSNGKQDNDNRNDTKYQQDTDGDSCNRLVAQERQGTKHDEENTCTVTREIMRYYVHADQLGSRNRIV